MLADWVFKIQPSSKHDKQCDQNCFTPYDEVIKNIDAQICVLVDRESQFRGVEKEPRIVNGEDR